MKKILAIAIASAISGTAIPSFRYLGNEGPADFKKPRPFGYEKPWGKKNRRKLGGMKGGKA